MKRLLLLFPVLLLLVFPVSADNVDGGTDVPIDPVVTDVTHTEDPSESVTTDVTKTDEGVTVNVTIEQPAVPQEPVTENVQTDPVGPYSGGTFSVTQPDVLETIQSDGDVSVMVDVIENVLGEYRRQTYTVEEFDAEGNLISSSTMYVDGLAGLDYHWLAGAAVFLVFFTGSFKLLGGLIR